MRVEIVEIAINIVHEIDSRRLLVDHTLRLCGDEVATQDEEVLQLGKEVGVAHNTKRGKQADDLCV